jgi:DNA end-binding protein Ku
MATKSASKSHHRSPARGKSGSEDDDEGHGRRALWSGSISFGLLQIPVSLHTAEQTKEIKFHQLDRHDLAPIHYQRVNASTGKVVEWKDIVRGYEYASGEYVVIDDDDLAAANVEATQTIDLQDFVDVRTILPTYFERPYYIAPGKRAEKAYTLFREALERKKVVAVGTVVIRTRQHLCAIFPQDDLLVLELLRFAHDLRGTEGIPLPKPDAKGARVTPREREMAEELIESMRSDWKPARYQDTYYDDLMALIERKAKTGKIEKPAKRAAPRSNVVDLMTLLRKSVEARGGHHRAANEDEPASAAKRASSKRASGSSAKRARTRAA